TIKELQQAVKALKAQLTIQTRESTVKIVLPEKFNSTKGKLRHFLTSIEMYLRINTRAFPTPQDNIMAASMYLKGDTLKWMQPYLRDYLNNHEDGSMRPETDVIFKSY
ncbi:hypothetical protein K432DRAFT_459172, partial [Lepidopterella palustris CBS 459.81]